MLASPVPVGSMPVWWLPLCLLVGLAYAFLLYSRKGGLPSFLRWLLFSIRAFLIALIALLILGPIWKAVNIHIEKPLIVVAQDRSESVRLNRLPHWDEQAYERSMKELVRALSRSYEVRTYSFGSGVQQGLHFDYTEQATDFSALLKEIETRYENRNLGAVIIASDGIYNRGTNPAYSLSKNAAPFYTIALGDSLDKKDIFIEDVDFNDLVYQGDNFHVDVRLKAKGLKGSKTMLRLSSQGKQLFSKEVLPTSDDFELNVPLSTPATRPGYQKYELSLDPVAGELTQANNHRSFYMEVIKGKQKILILYAAPHPDLSALKQGLEAFKNYEPVLKSLAESRSVDIKQYDLVVLHQLPNSDAASISLLHRIEQSNKPVWYIFGSQTDYQNFNSLQAYVGLNGHFSSPEEMLPEINPHFSSFLISDSLKQTFPIFPPLQGPSFGYNLKNQASVVVSQMPGRQGSKPLLFISENGVKTAFLMGEGFWRWRLNDFEKNQHHHASDELLQKMVQYLTAKEDKRRFRVSMPRRIYSEDESPIFKAELFNASYERITSQDIIMEIKNQAGKIFRFAFTKEEDTYSLQTGILPPDEYTYHAWVQQEKAKQDASGSFSVKALQLESFHTRAEPHTLQMLSTRTGGKMISVTQISNLPNLLAKNELIRSLSHEEQALDEWISFRWIALILIFLLSMEWGLRKWNGMY